MYASRSDSNNGEPWGEGPMPTDFGNVAEIASAVIAAFGFFFAILELHRSTKNQRSQFLLDTTQKYFGDVNVRRLYYEIDYREIYIVFQQGKPRKIRRPNLPERRFLLSAEEMHLDALLYTLDSIGRIFELGTLKPQEAKIFSFQARRVLSHPSVAKYVDWVSQDRARLGGETPAFRGAYVLAELFGPLKVGEEPSWLGEIPTLD